MKKYMIFALSIFFMFNTAEVFAQVSIEDFQNYYVWKDEKNVSNQNLFE